VGPALGLLSGIFIFGPLIVWLIGGFNPMGYFGVPPWHPAVRDARDEARRKRVRYREDNRKERDGLRAMARRDRERRREMLMDGWRRKYER
jgi:hypothetical protein